MSNRAPRFQNKRDEVPGPGAYAVENKENKPVQLEIKVPLLSLINLKFFKIDFLSINQIGKQTKS